MVSDKKSNDTTSESITNEFSQTCSGPSRTSSTLESPSTVVPVNLGVSHTPTSLTSRALSRPRRSWRRRACTAVSSESTTLVKWPPDPRATGLTVVADTRVVTGLTVVADTRVVTGLTVVADTRVVTGLTVVVTDTRGVTAAVTLANTRGVAVTVAATVAAMVIPSEE
jgi:hypothetical protein